MSDPVATAIGLVLLVGVLVFAIVRPRGLPEAVAAVPAAALAIAVGVISPDQARESVAGLAPTIGFLAAILVIAHLVEADGVFRWLGGLLAERSRGDAHRLLALVFAAAAVTTAVLSLDATVVLLTPVILATVRRVGVRGGPPVYAAAHLSNSASLLLPVSNLTNLLAFHASGLTFLGFAGLMAAPWLVCIAVEFAVFRWDFRGEFLVFVAALGVVVDAATSHGLQDELAALLPSGTSLVALLALAVIAAVLANLINNLPATLVLLAALGTQPATGAVLALLIGVNVGPNLTYTGSLATLLWRRVLHQKGHRPSLRRFTVLGLLTVPACLLLGTTALWATVTLL